MKLGYIVCIIAMASVLIYFILNYFAPSFPSWIVFIAAGIGIVTAGAIKNKDKGGGTQ